MIRRLLPAAAALALAAPASDAAQTVSPTPAGIQWYATLVSGIREAKRTGRPILLLSAAPHCAGVPGIW